MQQRRRIRQSGRIQMRYAADQAESKPSWPTFWAHEVGHILQRSDQHAGTGVMKAHWTEHDFEVMEKKRLRFTPDDIDLIVLGLASLKARTAAHISGGAIMPRLEAME